MFVPSIARGVSPQLVPQALAIFGIANDAGSNAILCYSVARPVRGAGGYPQSQPLSAAPQDGVLNRTAVDGFQCLPLSPGTRFTKTAISVPSGRFPVVLIFSSNRLPDWREEPYKRRSLRIGNTSLEVSGIHSSHRRGRDPYKWPARYGRGVDSVIGWLKDHVGEAKTTAALIKLIDWIEEQAGLPGFLVVGPRIGLRLIFCRVDKLDWPPTGSCSTFHLIRLTSGKELR